MEPINLAPIIPLYKFAKAAVANTNNTIPTILNIIFIYPIVFNSIVQPQLKAPILNIL